MSNKKLNNVLNWIEKLATIAYIIVPATREVVGLLDSNKSE